MKSKTSLNKKTKAASIRRKASSSRKTVEKISKRRSKKISVKEVVDKVVDVIKKPFNKKTSTKDEQQPDAKDQLPVAQNTQPAKESSYERRQRLSKIPDEPFAESNTLMSTSKLFYSNERFIDTYDDEKIYESISQQYPGLLASEHNEQVKRKSIIDMLQDVEYMQSILDGYDMTILDFFRFLFRLCPSVFKGLFVKKVQNTIKSKSYAKQYKISTSKSKQQKKLSRKYSIF